MNRIIITFFDPDCTRRKEINGHIFEVIEYAYLLHTYFKGLVEVWLPYRYQLRILKRLIHLRYTKSFIQRISDIPFRYISYMTFLKYFNEMYEILKKSCIISTDGQFFIRDCLVSKPLFVDTLITLPCNRVKTNILFCNNFYVLFNKQIYIDYQLDIVEPIVYNTKTYITDYAKKVALKSLVFKRNHRKQYGICTIYKGNDTELQNALKNPIDTVFVSSPVSYKCLINRTNKKVVLFPVSYLHSKISAYVYQTSYSNFDCSNRLVKECQFFEIPILNHESYSYIQARLNESLEDVEIENDLLLVSIVEKYIKEVHNDKVFIF